MKEILLLLGDWVIGMLRLCKRELVNLAVRVRVNLAVRVTVIVSVIKQV